MKNKLFQDASVSVIRIIKELERLPNKELLLKAIAPTINYNENITRTVMLQRREVYTDELYCAALEELEESTLISLLTPSMFVTEYGNFRDIPFLTLIQMEKYNFLNEYVSSYLSQSEASTQPQPLLSNLEDSLAKSLEILLTENFSVSSSSFYIRANDQPIEKKIKNIENVIGTYEKVYHLIFNSPAPSAQALSSGAHESKNAESKARSKKRQNIQPYPNYENYYKEMKKESLQTSIHMSYLLSYLALGEIEKIEKYLKTHKLTGKYLLNNLLNQTPPDKSTYHTHTPIDYSSFYTGAADNLGSAEQLNKVVNWIEKINPKEKEKFYKQLINSALMSWVNKSEATFYGNTHQSFHQKQDMLENMKNKYLNYRQSVENIEKIKNNPILRPIYSQVLQELESEVQLVLLKSFANRSAQPLSDWLETVRQSDIHLLSHPRANSEAMPTPMTQTLLTKNEMLALFYITEVLLKSSALNMKEKNYGASTDIKLETDAVYLEKTWQKFNQDNSENGAREAENAILKQKQFESIGICLKTFDSLYSQIDSHPEMKKIATLLNPQSLGPVFLSALGLQSDGAQYKYNALLDKSLLDFQTQLSSKSKNIRPLKV